ncbi:hypothetical protein [Bacillus sp. 2CMS4F]|uniref:hypothetical protein n=1 Tax=Bacillus sp. 2CMS4F TaxID=2929170 RepID=UPI0020C0607B|nr:hypothetical protein [Bacillus sp. 2CMS4F]
MAGLNGQSYAGSMTACLGKQVRRPRYLKTGVMAIPDFLEQRFDHRLCCFIPAAVFKTLVFRFTETFGISTFMAV